MASNIYSVANIDSIVDIRNILQIVKSIHAIFLGLENIIAYGLLN